MADPETAPPAGPPPRLRAPRVIEVALALSLAFNMFICGGIAVGIWHRAHTQAAATPPQDHRLQQFALALGLAIDQPGPFRELRRSLFQAGQTMRAENQPVLRDFWTELDSPTPDNAHLRQLTEALMTHRQEYLTSVGVALDQFLGELTPEQRRVFARIVKDRGDPLGQPLRGWFGS